MPDETPKALTIANLKVFLHACERLYPPLPRVSPCRHMLASNGRPSPDVFEYEERGRRVLFGHPDTLRKHGLIEAESEKE